MKLFIPLVLSLGYLAKATDTNPVALNIPGGKPFMFNAVAVYNYPNWNTQQPRESTLEGANFYTYATNEGFLSFGWWLEASPGTNYSHCRPDSPNFMYYEYSDKMYGCTGTICKAHVLNYWASNNSLNFETNYVYSDASLAPPELGTLSTFYRDEKQGPSAVGTRRVLSSTASTASECCKALKTLREVKDKYKLELNFELNDICPGQKTAKKPWWHWGHLPMNEGCDSQGHLNELR